MKNLLIVIAFFIKFLGLCLLIWFTVGDALIPFFLNDIWFSCTLLAFPYFNQMFISALIDVAGHAGKVDAAFEILQEARAKGMHIGIISYSSLMGACSKV